VSRVATRALGAVALTVCSCTLLYDPSQYWVDGGPDAGTAEIDADTAEIDARIPSGLDADLDAFVVPADAWAADIYVPPNADADLDAGSDAFSTLDAFAPTCPAGTSLGLGSCAPVNGVAYCDPATGATRYLSEAMAGEVLPGARHELSLLGNGNLLVEAAVGDIVDFELAREGNRLVAVWLDDSTREVSRGVYTVGASGLSTPTITRAGFGGSSSVGTDLSIRPGPTWTTSWSASSMRRYQGSRAAVRARSVAPARKCRQRRVLRTSRMCWSHTPTPRSWASMRARVEAPAVSSRRS
jgi:hypothetical protein